MWWNDYVGLPFKWNGRDRDGVSCWGLVCLVHQEVFGNHLPQFDECPVRAGQGEPAAWQGLGQEIDPAEVQSGDVLHLRSATNLHCGIVTVPGSVLHIERGVGSHIRKYETDRRFRNRVLGAYRVDSTNC